jgi:membrane protein YqaA with SNARE-associated domain
MVTRMAQETQARTRPRRLELMDSIRDGLTPEEWSRLEHHLYREAEDKAERYWLILLCAFGLIGDVFLVRAGWMPPIAGYFIAAVLCIFGALVMMGGRES